MIDKLEVGKKYVDKKDDIIELVYFDLIANQYVGREMTSYKDEVGAKLNFYYPYGGGVVASNLIKEYTEPKTVSGEFVLFEVSNDTVLLTRDMATFITNGGVLNIVAENMVKQPQSIHLDNVVIEEIE